jgi:hypothetical protein
MYIHIYIYMYASTLLLRHLDTAARVLVIYDFSTSTVSEYSICSKRAILTIWERGTLDRLSSSLLSHITNT